MTVITWLGLRVKHLSGWGGQVVATRQGKLVVRADDGTIRVATPQSVRVQK